MTEQADIEAWEKVRDAADRLQDDLQLLESALDGEEPLGKQIRLAEEIWEIALSKLPQIKIAGFMDSPQDDEDSTESSD